jgi:hypothetical protein
VILLSVAEVSKTFKQVNIHKAAGLDWLPGLVIKACADQLASNFTDIFNLSLNESVSHPSHRLFSLLPHGKWYRSAKSRIKRLLNRET